MIIHVPNHMCEDLWPQAEPHIRAALAKFDDEVMLPTIRRGLTLGNYQLWLVVDEDGELKSATTTCMSGNTLILAQHGGKENTWSEYLSEIEEFARRHGCNKMEIRGRRGWKKALPEYKEHHTIFIKEIA